MANYEAGILRDWVAEIEHSKALLALVGPSNANAHGSHEFCQGKIKRLKQRKSDQEATLKTYLDGDDEVTNEDENDCVREEEIAIDDGAYARHDAERKVEASGANPRSGFTILMLAFALLVGVDAHGAPESGRIAEVSPTVLASIIFVMETRRERVAEMERSFATPACVWLIRLSLETVA